MTFTTLIVNQYWARWRDHRRLSAGKVDRGSKVQGKSSFCESGSEHGIARRQMDPRRALDANSPRGRDVPSPGPQGGVLPRSRGAGPGERLSLDGFRSPRRRSRMTNKLTDAAHVPTTVTQHAGSSTRGGNRVLRTQRPGQIRYMHRTAGWHHRPGRVTLSTTTRRTRRCQPGRGCGWTRASTRRPEGQSPSLPRFFERDDIGVRSAPRNSHRRDGRRMTWNGGDWWRGELPRGGAPAWYTECAAQRGGTGQDWLRVGMGSTASQCKYGVDDCGSLRERLGSWSNSVRVR